MAPKFAFDPDYEPCEVVWTQPKALLVRARSARRRSAVLLKIARDGGDPAAKAAWEREYEILKSLGREGADAPLGLESWNGVPVLVLPDTGALPLSRHEPLAFAEPSRFLSAASEICAVLEKLHREERIHQFLTPDNILVNRANLKAGLLGLVHASPFFRKARGAFDLRIREGGLHWVAPEQTGMINRLMDGRTDIYALGCVFYWMLTGREVCESEDAAETMAFHLAGRPVPAGSLNPDVPGWLWAIVEKCLQKEPDERYQTIGGLLADISACLEQVRKSGKIASFSPGRHDVSPTLRPSGRIVGRKDEMEGLSGIVQRVAEGGQGAVLVAGRPGVGKTSLVSEIFPVIAGKKMTILSGKFEPVTDNRPYAGVCQAISAWAMSLSFEEEARKKEWTERLRRAMGGLGRVISDLSPEAAFLFDAGAALPDFPPREAQGRFSLALSRFFSALAEKDGLALFLDDLQWADQATLSFLVQAAGSAVSGRFLLVGVFRDNEAADNPHIDELASVCASRGENGRVITLYPLSLSETRAMVDEVCGGAAPEGGALADFIFGRTSGNPLFVTGLLQLLNQNGALVFDPKNKRFAFNAEKAGGVPAQTDQRALLRGYILSLSGPCREMLCVAAAAGNSFSPGTVAELWGASPEIVEEQLAEAAARRLVRPVSGSTGGHWLAFSHDHVREEAYSLLPPGRAATLHLALSRMKIPGLDTASSAYFAADHANLSADLLNDEKERMGAALKNLAAGRLAREAAAFGSAWRYLSSAVSFLPENAWKKHYKTTLKIYTAAAEAAYLAADKKVASHLSAMITREAGSDIDRANALRVAMLALVAQNRMSEAVDKGLEALRAIGIRLPENPGKTHLFYYYFKARLALPRRKWKNILARPDNGPARKSLAMSICSDLGLAAFVIKPNLTAVAGLQQLAMLSRGRLCPQAAATLAGYAFILCQIGRIDEAYEIGLIAEKLQERWPGHPSEAITLCIAYAIIRPWKEHLRDCQTGLGRAFDAGIRAGNFYWGTIAEWVRCYQRFYTGAALSDLIREIRHARDEFKAMGQEKTCLYLELDILFFMALAGASEGEIEELRKAYGYPDDENRLLEAKDEIAINILYANEMFLAYLSGNFGRAAECGRRLDNYLNGALGTQALPVIELFDCLSMLALPDPFADKKRLDEKIAHLAGWAKHCPQNNRHKLDLVNAELARVNGRPGEAARLYAAAIEGAKENGFLNFEALGLELFAKFRLSNEKIPEGMELMGKARRAYAAWGAKAKVKSLDEKFGMVFLRPTGQTDEAPVRRERPALGGLADSSKILAELMEKVRAAGHENRAGVFLSLLCPLAGASGGAVFVREHRTLAVKALWRGEGSDGNNYDSITGEEPDRFFAQKAMSLEDWIYAADISKADLPQKYRRAGSFSARSILCGPVETDWKKGALYLENRFLTDAFDPVRVNLVKRAARMFSRLEEPLGRFKRR